MARGLLTAGQCTHDEERLGAGYDGRGQRRVGGLVRHILLAGKEADERAALLSGMVSDGAAQDRIALLERIEE